MKTEGRNVARSAVPVEPGEEFVMQIEGGYLRVRLPAAGFVLSLPGDSDLDTRDVFVPAHVLGLALPRESDEGEN